MAVLVLLVLVAAAGLLLALQRFRRLRGRRRRAAVRERTLFDLQLGDIVQADGRDWVVEDRLLYEEEGFQWLEYLLRDGDEGRWLVVNEDDWLEVSWLETVPFTPPRPLPRQLEWEGEALTLREQGQATVTARLRTLNKRPGQCRYADYVGSGGRMLCVELWGSGEDQEAEVTAGHRIEPTSLTLLPGDGRSVYR
ncbi:DUF4178 domain-containing protein [Cyanobium sp. PCC 7001]|uniref:DUF4178 domain-containing protein n=1 Tax=Cyanobium sp. PCC 7001 TaxID=180281 RepID=UPI0002D6D6AE|nr:DUF4178 domain-containing protein [Cyanobium sp. PCC 7001]